MRASMRKITGILACLFLLFGAAGCRAEARDETKLRDLEFAVIGREEIPEEMLRTIEEKKEEPFQITYGDQEALYIGQGYGRQPTGGYSITVDSCYEAPEAVVFGTSLIGPGSGEETGVPTYPYVVVKLAWKEKQVLFQNKQEAK